MGKPHLELNRKIFFSCQFLSRDINHSFTRTLKHIFFSGQESLPAVVNGVQDTEVTF